MKKIIKKIPARKILSKKLVVTKNMTFAELLEKKPESMNDLFEAGLHCIGCHMSAYETIEQGCLAHGMSKKEIDDLIKKLNGEK
jgi:hybrid cluster-associated redox disulfide protein